MGQLRSGLRFLATATLMLSASTAQASISRVSNPVDIVYEPKVFVKFDAAYDSANRVYLAVWGTQLAGPVNGVFLNEAGAPIGAPFAISDPSDGSLQSGWARVIYSAQEGKFLVSYTKILAANVHGKAARFVAYSGGGPAMSGEIRIASGYAHPGTESGIAYSPASRTFMVTWWTYYGPTAKPITFVTAINPGGGILSPAIPGLNGWGTPITDPNDGQADPEIACDPASRHCLVIGFSWGTFYGGTKPPPAVWARFIDDATGAPLGADSFYVPIFGFMDSPTVSFGAGRFIVAYTGNGQVYANLASGGAVDVSAFGGAYPLRVSSAATAALDGGGYRYPSLSFNSATNTTLLAAGAWQGYPTAQEIDAGGQPITGALDFLPDPGPNYDTRTQYTIPVANNVTSGFLYLDNHYFLSMRSSVYSTTPGGPGAPPPPPPPPPPPTGTPTARKADFSSDGKADIVWEQDDGHLSVWAMNGMTATASPAITPGVVDPAWRVVATGDFNGDGKADLVWEHTSGTLSAWFMDGPTMIGSAYLNPVYVDPGWRIVGSGDFNGDGKADLVWQHTNGSLAVWYMNGVTAIAGEALNPGQIGYDWKIMGVGDFNGDGKPDLVWQHPNGALWIWFMNGPNAIGSAVPNPGQVDNLGWKIRAVVDLNGDGQTDLIWQNMAEGWLCVWLMNGTNATGGVFLNPANVSGGWKIVGPR
jgi:hypothetical protein